MVKKTKPVLHDPVIISRVQQYLEENVDKTYVDVAVMAKELQTRWPEYSRRKTVPFRQLVEQAYKTVLHSYGLDSNPSSEDDGSDVEVMSNRPNNQMGDTLNNLYGGKKPGASSNNDDPIDISSDESDDDKDKESEHQMTEEHTTAQKTKADTVLENGTARAKKRKLDDVSDKSAATPSASKARKFKKEVIPKAVTVTFADVGGMDKTLKQLCELLMHIKHPEIYHHIGLPPPRGFLLHGPPGSGKTLLANAIAGQLSIPLLDVPATELIAGVSGESEERIRDVFDQAAALAPCVLFLDEIDAISSNRINASKDMERRIVAQLINSLDGLTQRQNGNQVLVIGATNRSDNLDPALRRVGRFDQEISLGIPDRQARKEILEIICKNLKLDVFDFDQLAALTPGYVGADLLALATRAASTAVKRIFKSKEEEIVQVEEITEDDENDKQMEVDQILDGIVDARNKPKANGDTVEIIDDDVEPMVDEPIEIVEQEKQSTNELIESANVKDIEEKTTTEPAKKDVEVEEAESVAKMVAELSEENAKSNEAQPMETDEPVQLEPTVESVSEGVEIVPSEPKPSENGQSIGTEKVETEEKKDKLANDTEPIIAAEIDNKPPESIQVGGAKEIPAIVEDTTEKKEQFEKPVEDLLAELDEAAMDEPEKESIPELIDEIVDDIVKESSVEPIVEEPVTMKILEAVTLTDIDMANFAPELPKVTTKVIIKPLNLNDMLSWLNSGTPPLSQLELQGFKITFQDFLEALKLVQPSAKREGFITVPDVTWNDIGSLQDIREELKLAILAPVKYPERLKILGISAPSGVLLCGPPGCGKTLLAKAVANEAGINFISVKGPELLNMYVGESERAVRQCFQRARNSAPCVIFFDEFDSLCPRRSDSGENTAGQRVVNQLLTEMDGIEDRRGVYLMAATNRPDIVDPAVLRPGRFDKILYVGLPNFHDRTDILKALTRNGTKPPMANDVDMIEIAEATDGFTGADLAGLIRQASLYALKSSISASEDTATDDLKVHKEHLVTALHNVKPSVSTEDKVHYEKLKKKYGYETLAF